MTPFYAGEVDAPLVAVARGSGLLGELAEHLPGKGDFHRPAAIAIARVIERAVHENRGLEPGNLPAIVALAAVAIWFAEQQVLAGVERVDLEFAIVVIAARRIDEHLEIIVLEDDGIVLGERAPDVRLL